MTGRPLLLGLALAAAPAWASAQPPPVTTQDLAAMRALKVEQECLLAHAKAADDHISDAARIAAAMKDACRAEEDRFLEAVRGFAARHPGMETPPRVTEQERIDAAKAAVEAERRSR